VLSILIVLVLGLAAGCSGTDASTSTVAGTAAPTASASSSADSQSIGPSGSDASSANPTANTTAATTPTEKPPVAAVTSNPAFGSADISPVQPVSISVAQGKITDLQMTNPAGEPVDGTTAPDGSTWTLAEPLGYGKTYTVTGNAMGADGKSVAIAGTYSTVEPVDEVTTSISPRDGATVGVAAPVIVSFGYEPVDRALIERNVHITTTPHVDGAFAWIRHDGNDYPSLDWRPNGYWPANTQVHVESDNYGLDFGNGFFGGDNAVVNFTVGRNQVVLADAQSYQIVVQRDGQTVATYPASYGSGDDIGDPNRVTRSGIHVVIDKQETTKMSNPAYGYTNIIEHWAVRISDNGEFIHQNQGTVDDQGVVNVSHGCINLSAENAEEYFNSAIYGDPVEVTNTSVPLSSDDGDLYDWAIPWDEWVTMATNAPSTTN
jgi:lipoprotein-anchoring transpeptidase ErfK/SrfK